MVKIGDNVRFLNAVGGGVVTKIQKDLVFVADADGFETPVLAHEVVVINTVNQYNFPSADTPETEETVEANAETPVPTYEFDEREETAEGENLSVYLAFVLDDVKQIQTTKMACYLINGSNYYLNFNYLRGEKELELIENGRVEPQTKLWLEEVEKEELNDFSSVRFQAIAFKNGKAFDVKPVIDSQIAINSTKFYKLHSFSKNDYFDKEAWIVPLIENDGLQQQYHITEADLKQAMAQKQPLQTHSFCKAKELQIIEIDLHINQLLDTTAGMTNADMLQVQLNKFHEVMRENLKNKGQKIVFIHGKGEGILRKAIENELKTKYRSCYFQDASFQQYGFGATQITIR